MDVISTLTLFATILGISALVGGALSFLFAHDHSDPLRRLKRSLITGGTILALLITFLLQYVQAPASSLLTLIPEFPFPGSTLNACSVSVGDLPHGTKGTIAPSPDTAIAGISLTIRGGSALSGPMTTAAGIIDHVDHTAIQVHASNSSQGIEDVEAGNADWSFEHIYTKMVLSPGKRPAIDDFLRYACSDSFKQDLLAGDGFLRIADLQPQVFAARQATVEQKVHECTSSDIPTS